MTEDMIVNNCSKARTLGKGRLEEERLVQEVAGSETTRDVLSGYILNVICMIAMIATTVGVGLCG